MITIKSRQELIEKTREYLGTPFLHRGRSKRGIDCGGLIVKSLHDLGYNIEDMTLYGREPKDDSLRQYLIKNLGNPISINDTILPGDVALIRFTREPHHVALIGDYPVDKKSLTLIHSFGSAGKVVEHRLDEQWKKKIIEIYRFNVLE